MPPARPNIREATNGDGDRLAALIAACFAEYPGCVFDRARELPELDAIASHFAHMAGVLWVATRDDQIVGSLGVRPNPHATLEILKVYVAAEHRGSGLAVQLLQRALTAAQTQDARALELWSDSRFTRGHAFYEKHGFAQTGETRDLADLSSTRELRFLRWLK